MSGFTTGTIDHLTRAQVYSTQLKEVLLDELMAMKYVEMISDFPDGDTLNIPSVGQMEVSDYNEDQAVSYTAIDTGNYTFTITDYVQSGTYITRKILQDAYMMKRVQGMVVPMQHRALMKRVEVDALAIGPSNQTVQDYNTINDAHHRWVASGVNEVMTVEDFSKVRYALNKANVPLTNLVAIVDPSVGYHFETHPNFVNFSNNPTWEGIVATGAATGTRFLKSIMGFDVYVSQNLAQVGSEAIDGKTAAQGVANLFFAAVPGIQPFIGSFRQMPIVDSSFNKDRQREEYVTTARYGFGLIRPENLCVVLTDTDQVYA